MLSPRRLVRAAPCLIAALLFAATLAEASDADARPGFRLGVTDDPDALFLGFSYAIPLSGRRAALFVLEPGVDLGIGDDNLDFFVRGTAHFKYLVRIGRARKVVIYPLVGPEIVRFEFDSGGDDTEVGIDLGFGFGFRKFAFELWLGFDDDEVADVTAAFAYHF